MTEPKSISGRCLCGGIRYEITGEITGAGHCHCAMCRQQSGAAFMTAGFVAPGEFHWTEGEDLIAHYESSPGAFRIFCKVCGSNLGAMEDEQVILIFLGTVSGDPGIRPAEHIFVASKAPWHEITDDLPQYGEFPPSG